MPYRIEEVPGESRPFKIINGETGAVVGSSETREKAENSIVHRMEYEEKGKK